MASVANALECLGIKRSQREIARLCHVTEADGTDETEVKRALLANGVGIDELYRPFRDEAIEWLRDGLCNGRPAIICVDDDSHWVTVIGFCGDRFILFDPSRNMGVEVHDRDSIADRWVNSDGIYYGICISR